MKSIYAKCAYLTGPERDERAEGEAGLHLVGAHLGESSAEGGGEGTGRAGLNPDLGHLHGAQSNVGEDLSRGGTSKPDEGLVLGGVLLASKVAVLVLEDLVQTVLEHALGGVTDKSGPETLPDTARTFLRHKGLQTGHEASVLGGVDLEQNK